MSQYAVRSNDKDLSVREAAEIAGVHINTIYRWIYRGLLTAHRTRSRTYRIKPDDLDNALYAETINPEQDR